MMKINFLRVNHIQNPVGYDFSRLSLSWISECGAKKRENTRVQIASDLRFEKLVFDSGWKKLDSLGYEPYLKLEPYTRYYWRVSEKAEQGDSGMSETAYFETAKMQDSWSARWITAPTKEHHVFHTTFRAAEGECARAYICGLGLYEVYCNGKKVGEEVLLPGYHSYDFRLMYQTLELDPYVRDGENELAVMLAPGWYMGRFGFRGGASEIYGDKMVLLCEIHTADTVYSSDENWTYTKSPVLESNIYDGEIWDANLEIPEGTKEIGDRAVCIPDGEAAALFAKLEARTNPPVLEAEALEPQEIIVTPNGDTVLDFGQNLAGWFSFTAREQKGKRIQVEAAEWMQDGEFFRENLRFAKARLIYISNGNRALVRPHFTFFGYRYLRVQGCSDIRAAGFRAHVLSSVNQRTGWLTTSAPLVNRLIENARWGQLGNFVEVPTDCPQRDERMGWTGDTQIFCGTACYHYDSSVFYTKYMQDVWLEQQPLNGCVPYVIPDPKVELIPGAKMSNGSCAWGDVAVILPWTLYMFYGDKGLLALQYPSMKAWVEYIRTQETKEHLWQSGFHFADWLALDNSEPGPRGKTDPYYCASAYYYYSVCLTAKAARVTGDDKTAAEYEELAQQIRASFQGKYFDAEGNCTEDTQTAYVIALAFGLCREEDRERIAWLLHNKLEKNDMHLDTGFIGTGYLCKSLSDCGRHEDAVTLLLQKEMPGWLYPVTMGATTIWERWDSILPDGHMNPEGMNSLNHYAYGAVCEWIYRDLLGLSPLRPGFRKARFEPKPDSRLQYVKGEYHSAMGTYICGWEKTEQGYQYTLTVPFDCSARVILPGQAPIEVESGEYCYH